jgi:opacity protein-like surface antigen
MGVYDYIIPKDNPGDASYDMYGGGVGVGYNVNDPINVHAEFIGADLHASVSGWFGSASADITIYGGQIGVDYSFLKKRLTPFVTAGAGYWYATYQGSGQGLYFPYGGLGARWDFTDQWFGKAEYRLSYLIPEDHTSDTAWGNGFFVSVGFKF